jgi:hypothetical protein
MYSSASGEGAGCAGPAGTNQGEKRMQALADRQALQLQPGARPCMCPLVTDNSLTHAFCLAHAHALPPPLALAPPLRYPYPCPRHVEYCVAPTRPTTTTTLSFPTHMLP